MDDYTPTAISEKFDKVASALAIAQGYAFSNDINLSHKEECSRWVLIQLCCEVVRSAIEQGALDQRSLQGFIERRRGL